MVELLPNCYAKETALTWKRNRFNSDKVAEISYASKGISQHLYVD